jgi:hypothetical protein
MIPGAVALIVTCGGLGDPYLPSEIAFSAVEREHFQALAVLHERQAPSDAPLELRLRIVGDARDADVAKAFAWLEKHANIRVTEDANGAPLFLTQGDLAATSGRGTLGATVPKGMAVEMRDDRIAPCVLAHEILHFAGLKHVDDRRNIMYPHCSRDFLDHAQLEDWQRDQLSRLDAIRATTPSGVHVWAER